MGIGIDIRVNGTDKLREAKKEIEFVNTGLRDTESLSDVSIKTHGTEGMLAGIKSIVNETRLLNAGISDVVAEIRKLQGVGSVSIGLPGRNEMQGMADGVRGYTDEVGKAKKDLTDLAEAHSKVVNIGSRRPAQPDRPDEHYHSLIRLPGTPSPVSTRTEQAAQGQPPKEYKIREPQGIRTGTQIVSISHPEGDAFYDNYDPKKEGEKREREKSSTTPSPVSTRTEQAAQGHYNATTGHASVLDAAKKLKQIDAEGNRRGGVITPAQATEAARLYKTIQEELKKYEKEIERTGTKLDELFIKKKKLEQTAPLLRTEGEQEAVEQLKRQIDELTASAEKYQQKHDRMFDKVGTTADRSQQSISGYRQQEDPGARASIGATIKRVLGFGLAAAGGFSLLGFLSQSRNQYQQAIGHEGVLEARGMRDVRSGAAASMGVSPLEHMQLLENLSQTTGLTGPAAKRAAQMSEMFSKSQGVGLDEVSALRSSMYQATGKAGDTSNAMLATLSAQGIEKSRMPELLKVMERHLGVMASAYKGSGISDNQAVLAASAAVKAMGSKDIETQRFAKSGEFANAMQNSMLDTGSTAGNILAFSAAGGYDGDMTWKKQYDIQEMKEQGLWNPKMRKRMMAQVESMAGDGNDEDSLRAKASALKALAPNMGLSIEGYKQMAKAMGKGGILQGIDGGKESITKRLEEIKGTGGVNGKEAEKMLADIKANTANSKLSLEAQKQIVEIKAGEQIHDMFSKFERAVSGFAGALLDKNWKESFSKFAQAVDSLGPVGYALTAAATLWAGSKMLGIISALTKIGKVAAVAEVAGVGGAAVAAEAGAAATIAPIVVSVLALMGLAWMAKKYGDSKAIEKMEKQQKELAEAGPAGVTFGNSATAGTRQRTRTNPFAKEFHDAGFATGVDEKLLTAIGMKESRLRGNAISDKGAVGVMQLMPATAKGLGVDPTVPADNIMGGARHLGYLLKKYKNDLDKALAAYNMGEGSLGKVMNKHPDDWKQHLPSETSDYITGVRANYAGLGGNFRGIEAEPPYSQNAGKKTKDVEKENKTATAKLDEAKNITEGGGYFNVTSDKWLEKIHASLEGIASKLTPQIPGARAPALGGN